MFEAKYMQLNQFRDWGWELTGKSQNLAISVLFVAAVNKLVTFIKKISRDHI